MALSFTNSLGCRNLNIPGIKVGSKKQLKTNQNTLIAFKKIMHIYNAFSWDDRLFIVMDTMLYFNSTTAESSGGINLVFKIFIIFLK